MSREERSQNQTKLSVASEQQNSLPAVAALVKEACGERSQHLYDKTLHNPNFEFRITRLQFCLAT